jgi:hypothetical protein
MGKEKLKALLQESLAVTTRTDAMKPSDLACLVIDIPPTPSCSTGARASGAPVRGRQVIERHEQNRRWLWRRSIVPSRPVCALAASGQIHGRDVAAEWVAQHSPGVSEAVRKKL